MKNGITHCFLKRNTLNCSKSYSLFEKPHPHRWKRHKMFTSFWLFPKFYLLLMVPQDKLKVTGSMVVIR